MTDVATGTTAKRTLITLQGTPPTAPYSSAVRFGDLVWTSGQLPIDADGNTPADFGEQVELAIDNLEAILNESGASLATILKVSIFVTDIDDLPILNDVYRRRVNSAGAPARTTVQIVAFRGASRIEIDAVAHIIRDT
ncbi:RidA family protein [Geodermatophilus chilensis]|jgi:2-iminobutanoate/2-iminopropanoate deaminase|uniref:RidA family protein n=1 Tax=Geodermatophilus chilensis TaxID=2035835 RepID=UPI000C26345E|nr:RidA family protein [Geodermatophilus chilensis]